MKVHVPALRNAKERPLRAKSDILMELAMSDQPETYMRRMPLPLAYAKCLLPFSGISSFVYGKRQHFE